ncbi:MAG: hypothetical protein Kow0042_16270 [Calditrichia bacterium]
MIKLKVILTTLWFFIIFQHFFVQAQWSNDPTQNLQISTFGYNVKACEDGNGGAFIAWDLPHDQPFVWVQWVDRYGYVRWAQPIQVTGQEDNQEVVDIIKSTGNTAILAYMDKRFKYELPPPAPVRIYKDFITLTRIDTTGNFLWSVRATVDTIHQGDVVIVADESGGAYLTFNEIYPIYGDRDSSIVRLQRISNSGQRMWGDSGRYVYKEPSHLNPSPYLNNKVPEGLYFLHWEDNVGLIMESVEPGGSINWSNINDWYRRGIPTNDGGCTWAFKHRVSHTGEYMILANRMDSQGNLMWSDSGLVVADNLGSVSSVVDYNLLNDNSVVKFWKRQHINNPDDYKSYIQIIDYNGTFQFPDSSLLITSASDGKVSGLGLTLGDSLNFILTWKDTRTIDTGYYCQKYSKEMVKLWNFQDILLTTHSAHLGSILADNNFGMIMIWDEYFSPYNGVFAQQISRNGNLGEVLTSISSIDDLIIPERIKLYSNFPNPFNATTAIPFYLPHRVSLKITIYNVLGQNVKNLFQGVKLPGHYVINWDGKNEEEKDLPSGIYYVQLKTRHLTQTKKLFLLK